MTPPLNADSDTDLNEPPLHGYRGDPTPPPVDARPQGFTIAISREVGSRGGTIAGAVGKTLGWQVFTQEILEYLNTDETARAEILNDLSPSALQWMHSETAVMLQRRRIAASSPIVPIAKLIFALAARGECVLVGRGAGFLLPSPTTVHVRVVAPLEQRIAYFTQWKRLTEPEAREHVKTLEQRRTEYLALISGSGPVDLNAFDIALNSARLGIDGCAELVLQALRVKQAALTAPPPLDPESVV